MFHERSRYINGESSSQGTHADEFRRCKHAGIDEAVLTNGGGMRHMIYVLFSFEPNKMSV